MKSNQLHTVYGNFPASLNISNLSAICIPKNGVQTGPFGSQLHQKDYVDKGVPIITVEHLGDNKIVHTDTPFVSDDDYNRLIKYNLKKGDIVFSRVGSVDRRALVGEDEDGWLFSGRCLRVRPNNDIIDSGYLSYFFGLTVFKKYVRSIAVGATMPSINTKILSNLPIVYPPLLSQKKIAHILSTLDDKIDLNRKMNDTLEAMAQALFKSWFVDFDPVHLKAKCTSEEELEAGAKELGIAKEVLELFPSAFVESEMGMIPLGWEVVKIENILKRYRAPKRYKKDAVKSYGKTIVLEQGADIILGYHDGIGEFEATSEEPMFIFGDHTCVMKLSTKPFSISENVIPLSGFIRNGYWTFYATYGQQTFQEYRRHWSELTVRDIVLADKDICNFFAKQVQPLILKIEQNILENNELVMTRDTLLPKLLSGELDVSNITLEKEN